MSGSSKATYKLTLSAIELSNFLRIKDETESYLKKALQNFCFEDLFRNYIESIAFVESMRRPMFYIDQMPLVQTLAPAVSSSVMLSLCLDVKNCELYEYDNYKHSHSFSKKGIQQFKLLRKICESNEVYVLTSELMEVAGYHSIASTYKAIEKINSAGSQIGLPDKLLIGSDVGKGYRINPNYTVTVV